MSRLKEIVLDSGAKKETNGNVKIGTHLSENIITLMLLDMANKGKSSRYKSKWVLEALDLFFKNRFWKRIALESTMYSDKSIKNKLEQFTVPQTTWNKVFKSAHEASLYGCLLQDPIYIDVNIDSILRAAILYRLDQNVS